MKRLATAALREIAAATPFLRERYFEREFLSRAQSYKGIYPTFAAARAAIPPGKLAGYDHTELGTHRAEGFERMNPADYPVLFWMAPLLKDATTVFDLGGNIGVVYYAFRRYLAFPPQLRWIVCDVPAIAQAGEKFARERGESRLAFTDRQDPGVEIDIYFTAGALQYIEEPLAEILGKLPARPRHLLIQRIPLGDQPTFITLQNNNKWITPYRIDNEAEFIASLAALGYGLVDHWKIERSLEVLMSPAHKISKYHGMYFRLK